MASWSILHLGLMLLSMAYFLTRAMIYYSLRKMVGPMWLWYFLMQLSHPAASFHTQQSEAQNILIFYPCSHLFILQRYILIQFKINQPYQRKPTGRITHLILEWWIWTYMYSGWDILNENISIEYINGYDAFIFCICWILLGLLTCYLGLFRRNLCPCLGAHRKAIIE